MSCWSAGSPPSPGAQHVQAEDGERDPDQAERERHVRGEALVEREHREQELKRRREVLLGQIEQLDHQPFIGQPCRNMAQEELRDLLQNYVQINNDLRRANAASRN